jgi:hypothetical protein
VEKQKCFQLLGECKRNQWEFDGCIYNVSIETIDIDDDRALRSCNVMYNFNNYEPLSNCGFKIHNVDIHGIINFAHDVIELRRLIDFAGDNKLFSVGIDDFGLVVTSEAIENVNMNRNRWITDSVHCLNLVTADSDKAKIIRMLADFYCTPSEQDAFARIIRCPALYRNSHDRKAGVAHIFQVDRIDGEVVLKRDPNWSNNKRLESHGLALKTFCDFLLGKIATNADRDIEKNVCLAIASLCLYFQAIDYPTAPSAGAWEEIPLPGGLSWDTESIRRGLVSFEQLMFGEHGNLSHKECIKNSAKKILSAIDAVDLEDQCKLFVDEEVLQDLIQAGAEQVIGRVLQKEEAPGFRGRDASLAFLAQSDLELIVKADPLDSIIETVKKYIELLEYLENGLIRENGMVRYEQFSIEPNGDRIFFDSYLSLNYWLGFDEEGYFNPIRTSFIREFESMDASDHDLFRKRTRLGVSGREAEWFLVTEMAIAFVNQALRLRDPLNNGNDDQRKDALELYQKCKEKAWEYVYRGYARVTPCKQKESNLIIKSNGEECQSCTLPEAYEWVRVRASMVNGDRDGYVERVLPGANTPLAWACSSLKMASEALHSLLTTEC